MIRRQTYDPAAMRDAQRRALVEELRPLNDAIFEGVSATTFARYLLAPSACRNRIAVLRDAGRPVGYCTVQVHDPGAAPGRSSGPLVIRSVMGMLPDYRRKTAFGWFVAGEAARIRIAFLGRPLFGLACPIHPGSYRFLVNYGSGIVPHPRRETPAELQALAERWAAHFDLRAHPDHPGVFDIGWTTIQGARETAVLAAAEDEITRYYVRRNPAYREGYGLLVLIPYAPSTLLRAVARLASKRAREACHSALAPTRSKR